jgi:hypothetical protein
MRRGPTCGIPWRRGRRIHPWPAVLIHAFTNAVVNGGALAVPGYVPPTSGFVLATVLEVPLVFLGAGWFLRLPLSGAPGPREPDPDELPEEVVPARQAL